MIFFDPIAGLIHTPPICAVCERPVQSIETRHDLLTLEIVWWCVAMANRRRRVLARK